MEPASPASAGGFLTVEPPGKRPLPRSYSSHIKPRYNIQMYRIKISWGGDVRQKEMF